MFRQLFIPGWVLVLFAANVSADDKTTAVEQPILKLFVGFWKSEGDLKSANGGDGFRMKEEWTAKLNEDGELVIEGSRVLNDGAPEKFRWSMFHNPTTDLLEAVHMDPNDPASAMRFEGTATIDPPVLELRSGDSLIRFAFKGEHSSLIDTEVSLCNESGEVDLAGTVHHKKER